MLLTLVPLSTGTVSLEVRLLEASRTFEVSQNGNLVVSGERDTGPQGPPRASGWAPGIRLGSAQPSDPLIAHPPPTGTVYLWEDPDPRLFDNQDGRDAVDPADPSATFRLSQGDVYKELRLRGYDYGPHFQGILEASLEGGHSAPWTPWGRTLRPSRPVPSVQAPCACYGPSQAGCGEWWVEGPPLPGQGMGRGCMRLTPRANAPPPQATLASCCGGTTG